MDCPVVLPIASLAALRVVYVPKCTRHSFRLAGKAIGAATLYLSILFHFCVFWAQKQIVSFLDIALNHFPVYPSIRFAKSRFSIIAFRAVWGFDDLRMFFASPKQ